MEELERLGSAIREAETVGIPWEIDPTEQTKHVPKVEARLSSASTLPQRECTFNLDPVLGKAAFHFRAVR